MCITSRQKARFLPRIGPFFFAPVRRAAAAPPHEIDPISQDDSLLPARAQQEEQRALALVFGDGYAPIMYDHFSVTVTPAFPTRTLAIDQIRKVSATIESLPADPHSKRAVSVRRMNVS